MARKLKPPHEVKIINNIPRLVKENFTVRFTNGSEAPLTMQDGAVFDDAGNLVENVPDWLWKEYDKMTEEAKGRLNMEPPASAGKTKS